MKHAVLALAWVAGAAFLAARFVAEQIPSLQAPRTVALVIGLVAGSGLPAANKYAARPTGAPWMPLCAFAPLLGIAVALEARPAAGELSGSVVLWVGGGVLSVLLCAASDAARAAQENGRRYGIAWLALVAWPACAAVASGTSGAWDWSPLVWCAAGRRDLPSTLAPLAVSAVLLVAAGALERRAQA